MYENKKPFVVNDDKYIVYTEDGYILTQPTIIIDKQSGLLKWGNSELIKAYYQKMLNNYTSSGHPDMLDYYLLLEFDQYNGVFSIDEICTLLNYMILVSANGSRIIKMLNMDTTALQAEIRRLQEMGY